MSGFKGVDQGVSYYGVAWMVQGAWHSAATTKVDVWWSPQLVAEAPTAFYNYNCQSTPAGAVTLMNWPTSEAIGTPLQASTKPIISGFVKYVQDTNNILVGGQYEANVVAEEGGQSWNSYTCQGAIVNHHTVTGMAALNWGGRIDYNAGVNAVGSKSVKVATSAKLDTMGYTLTDAAIALAAGFSVYATTSSILF